MDEVLSNAKAKFNQRRNLICVVAFILLISITFVFFYYMNLISKNREKKSNEKESIKISALGSDLQDSTIALQRIEKKLNEFDNWINQQKSELDKDEQKDSFKSNRESELIELENTISLIENNASISHLEPRKTPSQDQVWTPPESVPPQVFPRIDNSSIKKVSYENYDSDSEFVQTPGGIVVDSFKQEGTSSKSHKWPNYIPSGTYVQAVMIQGVDASAAVSSQASPRPIVMRIVSEASLPNEVYVNLRGCRLIGAIYGDISSERGYIRLESISCSLKSRDTIDRVIDGYIVGWDGTEGVRGDVVRREKDLLANSFYSGLASGLGNGLSESMQRDLVSPLGVVREVSGANVFKNAAAQGVEKSFDRLSKYYIERAEQYHPIIQIGANQPVDIVFKKGFYLQDEDKPLILAQEE